MVRVGERIPAADLTAAIGRGACHKRFVVGIKGMGIAVRTAHRLALLCVTLWATHPAQGQTSIDRGASILIFPKIVADAAADTVVQLANLSDNSIRAHCAYVDGRSGSWQVSDFTVALPPDRAVHWTVARGRSADLNDTMIEVPSAAADFVGELICVQIDGIGQPSSGNELAGQASIHALAGVDVSSYTAVGLRGTGLQDGDEFLCLGDTPSDNCFLGVGEYEPCPDEWILPLPANGADTQISTDPRLATRLTIVSCSQNLRDGTPADVEVEITVFNEMAERFTASASVTCWQDLALADVAGAIFDRDVLGSGFAEARFRPADGSGGFLMVAHTTREVGDATVTRAEAGINLFQRGSATEPDVIVLPAASPLP